MTAAQLADVGGKVRHLAVWIPGEARPAADVADTRGVGYSGHLVAVCATPVRSYPGGFGIDLDLRARLDAFETDDAFAAYVDTLGARYVRRHLRAAARPLCRKCAQTVATLSEGVGSTS